MMKKSGNVPQPAFSGTEAILYVEKKKWDMVLLDLMLPGMDGEEVLRKMYICKRRTANENKWIARWGR
jgi:CheY-like chemotaxis protein